MADPGGESARQRTGGRVDPLGVETVRPQPFELVSQVLALLCVGGQPEAADAPKRISREALDGGASTADGLAPAAGLPAGAVATALTLLELAGRVAVEEGVVRSTIAR